MYQDRFSFVYKYDEIIILGGKKQEIIWVDYSLEHPKVIAYIRRLLIDKTMGEGIAMGFV